MRLSEWARIILLGNLVLFGLNPQTVDAQGWLTGPDVTSMGFSSGIGVTDDATDFGAGLVYSPDGRMDFGIDARKVWSTEPVDFLGDISLTQFGPIVRLNHFAEDFPVVASVSTSYSHAWASSDEIDALNLSVTADTWAFGGIIRGVFESETARWFPRVGINYTRSELTFEILGESLSENDGLTTLEIGMDIAFGSQGSYFVVGPSMSVNDSNTWYGISVGISKEKF